MTTGRPWSVARRLVRGLPAVLMLLPALLWANPVSTENVTARLVAERAQVAPGDQVDLALVLDIRPHWHTYWRHPGDSGEPPRIDWTLPEGVSAGPIRWPYPDLIRVGPLANYGYSGRAVHLIALQIPVDWPVGEPVPIVADVTWLVCEEECVPERARLALTLATAAETGPADQDQTALFADARARLPRPGVLGARARRGDGGLRLSIPADRLPAVPTGVQFFAGEWGLIEHAAEQPWQIIGGDLVMDLTPGETSPTRLAGLLVVQDARQTLAYEIDADPDRTGTGADRIDAGVAGALVPASVEGVAPPALGLPLALLFALLGGIVLNLMPCVFPVLAIKALGLARQGGAPPRERALHALAYSGGVLLFFGLLAALLLGLRAGGAAVGWGFQLQSPVFVTLMAYLFLVIGLALAGALTIGTGLMGLGGFGMDGKDRGHLGAVATGGLAALVAAPCTAPFMGAALGYAVTLPWPLALAIMLTLGLGLALPFVLLALIPSLAARLPRPGPWMETLKQVLAFPMFATAAWLVWVLSVQTGPAGVAAVLTGGVTLAFALWLLERTRNAAVAWRRATAVVAAAGLALALWLGIDAGVGSGGVLNASPGADQQAGGGVEIEPYSAARLAEARSGGRPVFVNMTAAWCITCLVNERVALNRDAVADAFAEHEVRYLKGDWTNRDPAITDYLAGFGRNGVPIYVLYPPGGKPHVLPQLLTESIVLDALRSVVGDNGGA